MPLRYAPLEKFLKEQISEISDGILTINVTCRVKRFLSTRLYQIQYFRLLS